MQTWKITSLQTQKPWDKLGITNEEWVQDIVGKVFEKQGLGGYFQYSKMKSLEREVLAIFQSLLITHKANGGDFETFGSYLEEVITEAWKAEWKDILNWKKNPLKAANAFRTIVLNKGLRTYNNAYMRVVRNKNVKLGVDVSAGGVTAWTDVMLKLNKHKNLFSDHSMTVEVTDNLGRKKVITVENALMKRTKEAWQWMHVAQNAEVATKPFLAILHLTGEKMGQMYSFILEILK